MSEEETEGDDFEACLEQARERLVSEGESALADAADAVDAALMQRPTAGEAWLVKAQVLAAAGDGFAALASVDQARACGASALEAQWIRAAVLADLGFCDRALGTLAEARMELGGAEPWLIEAIFLEEAAILESLGRPLEAARALEAGLDRLPDSEALRAGLAPLERARVRDTLRLLPGGRR